MKAQQCILQISWYDFITNDSTVREQMKRVDLPLVIADRRHAILSLAICLPEETPTDTMLQHDIIITKGSHLEAGWKHPPGQPWKTWLQQVIDVIWLQAHVHLCGDGYDPCWTGAAVSERGSVCISVHLHISKTTRPYYEIFCLLHVAMAQCSCDDSAIGYVFQFCQ